MHICERKGCMADMILVEFCLQNQNHTYFYQINCFVATPKLDPECEMTVKASANSQWGGGGGYSDIFIYM